MQSAARMEGVLDLAPQDRLDRSQRPTGHRSTGVVHAGEGRIVAALADARRARAERIPREALDRLDVGGGVAPLQLFVERWLRRESRLGTDGPQ